MGVTGASVQRRFARNLAEVVPKAADVVLIGDGEFHGVELLRGDRRHGWQFCVRLHADTYVRTSEACTSDTSSWRESRAFDPAKGALRPERLCCERTRLRPRTDGLPLGRRRRRAVALGYQP